MTQMVEFDLAKLLESMDQKLNRVLEAQIRLEGQVKTVQVERKNLQSGQDAINAKLNTQTTWLLSLLTALEVFLCNFPTNSITIPLKNP